MKKKPKKLNSWQEFNRLQVLHPYYVRCPECKELTAIPEYLEYHKEIECINCKCKFKNRLEE